MHNLFTLKAILKTQFRKAKIALAYNGKDALEKVERKRFSLSKQKHFRAIFMDFEMPIMDGREATLAIKQMLPT